MSTYTSYINPYDLAIVGTIFIGFSFSLLLGFTISFQAIKASMANPVKSLRSE